jgi:hypothetical protein
MLFSDSLEICAANAWLISVAATAHIPLQLPKGAPMYQVWTFQKLCLNPLDTEP